MMAHPGIREYSSREIVHKYIHYKLSQRGYDWIASGDGADLPPSAGGTFSALARPASLPSEPPGPAASDTGVVDGLHPVPQIVHLTLRQAGNEFSRRYQGDVAQMSGQLYLTPGTARSSFVAVAEELFRDGVNWGRIVAFFEFGGMMCVESVSREMSPLVDNVAVWMTEYLNRHLHDWIQDNGGWTLSHWRDTGYHIMASVKNNERNKTKILTELVKTLHEYDKFFECVITDAFVEVYSNNMRPLFDFSWLPLKTILGLAVVSACITLGAYLGHK